MVTPVQRRMSQSGGGGKIFFWCALTGMVFWGGYLRLRGLDTPGLWMDEAATVLQCTGVREFGVPLLPNGNVCWDSFPAVYLQALGGFFTPDPQMNGRVPAALAGTLCIAMTCAIIRLVTGQVVPALLAAFGLAFFQEQIAWSRQARPYIFVEFYFLLTLLVGVLWTQQRRRWKLAAAIIFSVLGAFTHRVGYLAPLTLLFLILAQGRYHWRIAGVTLASGALAVVAISAAAENTNSSIFSTLGDIVSTSGTGYLPLYTQAFWREYGWISVPTAVALAPWRRHGWFTRPVALAAFAMLLVIGTRTHLYADRYAFLFSVCVCLLFPIGMANLWSGFTSPKGRRVAPWALGALVVLPLIQGPIIITSRAEYPLGMTAPTPPWREAYALVRERETGQSGASHHFDVLSAFPALHDIYLSGMVGTKWYTPISYSGFPGDIWPAPPYTTAGLTRCRADIEALSGYAILDDFALRMMVDEEVRSYFCTVKPNAILRAEKQCVYIWILNPRQAHDDIDESE